MCSYAEKKTANYVLRTAHVKKSRQMQQIFHQTTFTLIGNRARMIKEKAKTPQNSPQSALEKLRHIPFLIAFGKQPSSCSTGDDQHMLKDCIVCLSRYITLTRSLNDI